jgi:hypothetical protein
VAADAAATGNTHPEPESDKETQNFAVPNQASGSRRKRKMTEVLWCNF